jgi:putative transposase
VQLPRVGRVHSHERFDGLLAKIDGGAVKVKRASISFSQGRWWCSFTIEDATQVVVPVKKHRVVGVDLGLIDLMVAATPEGVEVLREPAPKPLRAAQTKLAKLQRKAARQTRGSNRHRQTMRRVTKVHARVANVRSDIIHNATTKLARTCDTIVVEDLNVKGMGARKRGIGARGRGFNRAIADASMAEVRRQLEYKTDWYGGDVVVAGRWFPSSKTCSSCGNRKPKLSPGERQYQCPCCGQQMDRDLNAAVNLALLGVSSSRQWDGDVKHGRGAIRKADPSLLRSAGGVETSTQQEHPLRKTGTAASQEVAA